MLLVAGLMCSSSIEDVGQGLCVVEVKSRATAMLKSTRSMDSYVELGGLEHMSTHQSLQGARVRGWIFLASAFLPSTSLETQVASNMPIPRRTREETQVCAHGPLR